MAVIHSARLAVRVCQMYYLDNMNQKEISALLGISRPQISRILASARKENLVSITINDPYAKESMLQDKIRGSYPVRDVLVFDTQEEDGASSLPEFGRMAAQCLDLFVADGAAVGVMSGRTIDALVNGVANFPRRGLKVIPLVGGIGSLNPDWQANSVAQRLAEKSGGVSYVLNAPIVVQSPQVREYLIREPEISSVLELGADCETALVGIGDITEQSTVILAGGLRREDIAELREAGTVASACLTYLGRNGELLDVPLAKRSIGQSLQQMKRAKVIALAAGIHKAAAIHSALSSGFIDVFMTTVKTANKIIESQGLFKENKEAES